jgi:hypothetical protein
MPGGRNDDSNPAREWAEIQCPGDATARSPGAASRWPCPAIDTARAGDRGGNCGYWPHTPHVGSRRLLGVAHGGSASGQRGTAASHRVGEQSLGLRSGPLSRPSPREGEHSPREEPCAVQEGGWQEQTRSCARGQDASGVPTPGAGSTPIVRPAAGTPARRRRDCTSDRGLVPDPHLPEQAQRRHDADTLRRHRQQ